MERLRRDRFVELMRGCRATQEGREGSLAKDLLLRGYFGGCVVQPFVDVSVRVVSLLLTVDTQRRPRNRRKMLGGNRLLAIEADAVVSPIDSSHRGSDVANQGSVPVEV